MEMEAARILEPGRLLGEHLITQTLRHLGVSEDALRQTRFRHNNEGLPFDLWSCGSAGEFPFAALPFLKSFCALKWLILDNPACSRDTDDAWALVAATEVAGTIAIAERARQAQRQRAKKSRGRLTDDGVTVRQVIQDLASKPQHIDAETKQLWPHFFAELDALGLDPYEAAPGSDAAKWKISYDNVKGMRRTITFGRFANVVSEVRRRKSRLPGW